MSPLRIVAVLLFSLLAWGQTPNGVPAPSRWRVALDPGHGGDDEGAKGGKGLKEKDAALDLARLLRVKLEEAGFEVLLTRETDVFIPVWDRTRLANEGDADLFLSLHLNASKAKAAKGSEVYFLSQDAGNADAAEIAALENDGATPTADPENLVASILDDMAQKAFLQDSEKLAVELQNQLNRLGGIKERGVKQAPFAVLRSAAMPAVLLETLFISNPKEEAKLKDPDFLVKVAEAIRDGIQRYLTTVGTTPKRKALTANPATAKQPS